MLNMQNTRIFNTDTRLVLSSVVIPEEGMALVEVIEGADTKVKPSAGIAGEIFAGVSLARNAPPTYVPNIEEGVIPATLSVKLARKPVIGQILVKIDGTAASVGAGAPAAGAVQLVNDVLTFNAADAASTLYVQYLYEPTVQEARSFVGMAPIGGLPSSAQHVIGTITKGEFSTNMFDASVDWSTALQVKLGPNGTFTTGGSGTLLTNVVVRGRPSAGNAMLVLAVN